MKHIRKSLNFLFKLIAMSQLFIPFAVYADINSDLSNFFNSLGYETNATNPEAYQAQSAGYYTGGSLFARNSVRNVQIASVQLPSFRAGCGGIDLFTGGFSFINSQALIDALKNVASNALSYSFMLALKTVSPEISNTIEDLQSWANTINQTNINSCEAGEALVGAVWPKTDASQQQICESIGTQTGLFADWAAARQGCGAGGERTSILSQGASDPTYQNLVVNNTNLAWQAIQKNSFLSSDLELSELFLSLSGSIIVTSQGNDDDSTHNFSVLSSLADNRQLIKALLYGGQAQIYTCDTSDQCLNPTIQTVTIDPSEALGSQVAALLQDMVNHIDDDTALTTTEIGLLQSTSLPLYKMLNVQSAYVGDPSLLNITSYADVIAASLIYQYLSESLDVIQQTASTLQYPQDILTQFMSGLDKARQIVQAESQQNFQDINTTMTLIENTQMLERQLAGYLSANLSGDLAWSAGMR